jgi:hypothetical protein
MTRRDRRGLAYMRSLWLAANARANTAARRMRLGATGVLVLVVLGVPSLAHADSVVVTPEPIPGGPEQGGALLLLRAEAPTPAFVAETIKQGADAGCGANYATDLTTPGSITLSTTPGAGVNARILPTGAWTLCGWVEREGNTPMAVPSAVAGPVHFTMSGPAGTVVLSAPAVAVAGDLGVVVQYATHEVPGQFLGQMNAELSIVATSTAEACPTTEVLGLGGIAAMSVRAGESGSLTVMGDTGTLRPGTYELCAYLTQALGARLADMPLTPFAMASAVTTVVAHASPTVSDFSLSNRRFRTAAAPRRGAVPRGTSFRYSLDEAATVRITLARLVSGHEVGHTGRCQLGATGHTGRASCTIEKDVTTFEVAARDGMNSTRFSGLYGHRSLRPGSYVAVATAHSVTQIASSPVRAAFTVVR